MSSDPELKYLYALSELINKPLEEVPMPLAKGWGSSQPFPVDALPPVLKDAALAIHEKTMAPLAICGQSVLATATLAVQSHADVLLPPGFKKPLSSYFVSIAETGERKSAVDSEAMRPIREHEKMLDVQYRLDMKVHRNAHDAWEAARSKATKGDRKKPSDIESILAGLGDEPEKPLLPMLTCSEPTFEGLCRLYVEGQPSLGIFSAEGGQFIGGHGMSKEKKLGMATSLSDLWDGEPVKRVRAGDGISQLLGRRLSSHLQMQPVVAEMLVSDDMLQGQGYLSRTLVVAPLSTSGTRFSEPANARPTLELDVYCERIKELLNLPLPLAKDTRNELEPRELVFSEKARLAWYDFYNRIEAKVGAEGEYEPIKGLANKLPEHASRLAAVMALVEDEHCTEINEHHFMAGVQLALHYASEALRLYGASKVPADIQLAQRVLSWLQNHWKKALVSLTDIYKNTNYARTAKTARVAVDVLVEHGWLKPVEGGAVIDGQKRQKLWRVVGFEH